MYQSFATGATQSGFRAFLALRPAGDTWVPCFVAPHALQVYQLVASLCTLKVSFDA